jgi:hypothetical protein
MNLQEIKQAGRTYHMTYAEEGGTSEFDMSINDISRAKIAACAEIWPEVWLGHVNLYGDDRHGGKAIMQKWEGELVYNFEYAFAIPGHDAELEKLIRDRDDAEYTGTTDDYKRVDAIFARIETLGGETLSWA